MLVPSSPLSDSARDALLYLDAVSSARTAEVSRAGRSSPLQEISQQRRIVQTDVPKVLEESPWDGRNQKPDVTLDTRDAHVLIEVKGRETGTSLLMAVR